MLQLNIRQTQAEVAVRRIAYARLEAHSTPAKLTGTTKQARSNMGATQVTIDVDSYPSRHSYGFDNHTDFAKEHGERGYTDVESGTSSHTAQAWKNIDQAARPDSQIITQMYKAQTMKTANERRYIVAAHIPEPTITVHPSELRGTPEPMRVDQHFAADAFATTNFTPGKIETYLTQKGGVQQWVSEGRYDIRA